VSDRTLRNVVAVLAGLLVLVVAVTMLVVVGRNGSATGSPTAPPLAVASPSLDATVTPTESAPPSVAPTPEASVAASAPPSPSVAPSGSPGAPALATLTFVALKLDATADPGGEARVVTFRSDGAGTVTAKLGTNSSQGKTHMCLLVGTKEIGCNDVTSSTFTGKTAQGTRELDRHAAGRRGRRPDCRPDRDVPGGRAEGRHCARSIRRNGLARDERHPGAVHCSGGR
jgi:hypothetical protein